MLDYLGNFVAMLKAQTVKLILCRFHFLCFIKQQQGLEDDANDSEEEGSRKAVGNIHEPKDEDGGKDKEPRWILMILV